MRYHYLVLIIVLSFFNNSTSQNNSNFNKKSASNSFFIKNQGQIVDQYQESNTNVLYLLNLQGLNVQLRKTGFSYDIYKVKKNTEEITNKQLSINERFAKELHLPEYTNHRIDFEFLNYNPNYTIKELNISDTHYNYYNLENTREGIVNVTSYKKIIYQNIYQNIDVEFYTNPNSDKPVEYNFIIRPGGKIEDIKVKVKGADVGFSQQFLSIQTRFGNLKEIIPKSWIEGKTKEYIDVTYKKVDSHTFGFQYTNPQSHKNTIVIDPTPVREWATYFGGTEDELDIGRIITDQNGDVIIGSGTESHTNVATTGSYQETFTGWRTAYITKFDADGNQLWGTYYGGSASFVYNVTTDNQNNIIGVGSTLNQNLLTTPGAFQETRNQTDAGYEGFVAKFDPTGMIIWASYYGGEENDDVITVAVDAEDNIYIGGGTSSSNFIATPGSFKENSNIDDIHTNTEGFVAKLTSDGSTRLWATYYGGDNHESVVSIKVDTEGNIFIAGSTSSFEGIATSGTYQDTYSYDWATWTETYIAKFTSDGNRLWGTYYGGYDYDNFSSLVLDSNNNAIIAGTTRSNTLISNGNAHQPNKGGAPNDFDAYLAKFSPDGNILWSTFYGGDDLENWGRYEVAVDVNDAIYFSGSTRSVGNIATTDSYQENLIGPADMFIAKFEPNGDRAWGTYYGGSITDYGQSITVTNEGIIYALGFTYSNDNIASSTSVHQATKLGGRDMFIVKFQDCISSLIADVTSSACEGESISFTASGGDSYQWTGPNNFTSTDASFVIPNANASHSGTYTVSIVSGSDCDNSRSFEVIVSEQPSIGAIDDLVACEDVYNSGISSSFDTSMIEDIALDGQTNMVVSYYDADGNTLPSPLPNPMTNSVSNQQTITVRVSPQNNLECYAETTFDLIVTGIPYIPELENLNACSDNEFAVFDLSIIQAAILNGQSDIEVQFFNQQNIVIADAQLNAYTNSQANEETIRVRVTNTNTNCFNEATFNLTVNSVPEANSIDDIIGCDDNNDGISEYFDTAQIETTILNGQEGMTVQYFNANGVQLASPLPNPYTNTTPFTEQVTARVYNPLNECYTETIINFVTSQSPQLNTIENLYACDAGNGFATFDTSMITQQLVGNQTGLVVFYLDENGDPIDNFITTSFQNQTPFVQTINVRVENEANPLCFAETSFQLNVNQLPFIDLEESYVLCDLEPFLYVSVAQNYDAYQWESAEGTIISNTHEANLAEEGQYSLTVWQMQNGILCQNTATTSLTRTVLPEIQEVNFQDLSTNNYIEIIATGDGVLTYSIDGIHFQESNIFQHVSGGIYTVYVREANGCGEDSREVALIDYPDFFTPNGDGINDYWQIIGIEKYPKALIVIFDRYGKVLTVLPPSSSGWDGNYRGNKMPSSDYWFSLVLDPNVESREIRGHFTLKR